MANGGHHMCTINNAEVMNCDMKPRKNTELWENLSFYSVSIECLCVVLAVQPCVLYVHNIDLITITVCVCDALCALIQMISL